MKKIILGMTITIGLFSSTLYANQPDEETKKKQEQVDKFKSDCINSLGEAGTDQDATTIENLCDCVGKKASEIFTTEELKTINNQSVDGIPQEKLIKLQEAITNCAMN